MNNRNQIGLSADVDNSSSGSLSDIAMSGEALTGNGARVEHSEAIAKALLAEASRSGVADVWNRRQVIEKPLMTNAEEAALQGGRFMGTGDNAASMTDAGRLDGSAGRAAFESLMSAEFASTPHFDQDDEPESSVVGGQTNSSTSLQDQSTFHESAIYSSSSSSTLENRKVPAFAAENAFASTMFAPQSRFPTDFDSRNSALVGENAPSYSGQVQSAVESKGQADGRVEDAGLHWQIDAQGSLKDAFLGMENLDRDVDDKDPASTSQLPYLIPKGGVSGVADVFGGILNGIGSRYDSSPANGPNSEVGQVFGTEASENHGFGFDVRGADSTDGRSGGLDLSRTNELLQQLIEEVRRNPQSFLPVGNRQNVVY